MSPLREAPYGTWTSPISAQLVAASSLRLGSVMVDRDDIYWLEGRPHENGRYALVRRTADGTIADVLSRDVNVRTRVHEYGGGAYAVANETICYVNFADQRVYRSSQPLTPHGGWRYADLVIDSRRDRLICVREDHTQEGREPETTLVSIPLSGGPHPGHVIASGFDFYSTPRLSQDGSMLAWLCWRHPHMPWDGTELWMAQVSESGELRNPRVVAGGDHESIYQPGWSPEGTLYFVSDRDGWWRLYRLRAGSTKQDPASVRPRDPDEVNDPNDPNDPNVLEPVLRPPPAHAEFGRPQWIFGTSTWAFAGRSQIVATYTLAGRWHLAIIDTASGIIRDIAPGIEPAEWVAATDTHAVLVAGSGSRPDALVKVDLATGTVESLRSASSMSIDPEFMSTREAIEFPAESGLTAHAFYYAPRNRDFFAPAGERPPLIVISHGGPTTATKATLDWQIQFWTSRGIAVVDVNYGGSSGYGRQYRERLKERWGVVDVADVIHAARFLVEQGKADGARLIVRGASAGGYTTLAALTFFPDVFKAGASYYGVSDLEALAVETHKFESRYLDSLVGPYPARKDLYRERSPIHFVDRLSCAMILFQGLEDKVVPPNQSARMADAVRAKGLPVEYLTFEGEQHGFRKAETIVRCLEAELSFYGKVFGFTPDLA
jgi:dipeptidyl aminopeptidase/acylaminoacyl peptidase